jgi:DNA-binding NarL/FixJ family response regulator
MIAVPRAYRSTAGNAPIFASRSAGVLSLGSGALSKSLISAAAVGAEDSGLEVHAATTSAAPLFSAPGTPWHSFGGRVMVIPVLMETRLRGMVKGPPMTAGYPAMQVLIADDHPLFREALASVVTDLCADATCVEAASFDEALARVRETQTLDLILLDLRMPGADGLTGLALLRHEAPTIPVVVVSATAERRTVLDAIRSGAVGYLPKSTSRPAMISALQLVMAGGVYVPGEVVRADPGAGLGEGLLATDKVREALATLTRKQLQVLDGLAQGLSNKEIARALNLAEPTVKTHVSALLRKLNLRTRAQAIVAASTFDFSHLRHPEATDRRQRQGDG